MSDDKFVVDYPTETEVKQQLSRIIEKGLPKPKTFIEFLSEMHQKLGWRYIFNDYLNLTLIGILFFLYMIAFVFMLEHPSWSNRNLYTYLFISSPLLYGAISISSFIGKQETFEVEMTCKYNVPQITAYRMLVFSLISIQLNIIQILTITAMFHDFKPIKAIMISLTSLLIFAVGFLYFTNHHRSKLIQIYFGMGWVAINIGISLLNINQGFLLNVPYAVYGAVIAGMGILFVKDIRKMALKAEAI